MDIAAQKARLSLLLEAQKQQQQHGRPSLLHLDQAVDAATRTLSALETKRSSMPSPSPRAAAPLPGVDNVTLSVDQARTEADLELHKLARLLRAEGIPASNIVLFLNDFDGLALSSDLAWWWLRETRVKDELVTTLTFKVNYECALGLNTDFKRGGALFLLNQDYVQGADGAHVVRPFIDDPRLLRDSWDETAKALREAGHDEEADYVASTDFQKHATAGQRLFDGAEDSPKISLTQLLADMAQDQRRAKASFATPNLDFSESAQAAGARGRRRRADRPALGGRPPGDVRLRMRVRNPSKGISARIGAGTTPQGPSVRFPTNSAHLGPEAPRPPPPADDDAEDGTGGSNGGAKSKARVHKPKVHNSKIGASIRESRANDKQNKSTRAVRPFDPDRTTSTGRRAEDFFEKSTLVAPLDSSSTVLYDMEGNEDQGRAAGPVLVDKIPADCAKITHAYAQIANAFVCRVLALAASLACDAVELDATDLPPLPPPPERAYFATRFGRAGQAEDIWWAVVCYLSNWDKPVPRSFKQAPALALWRRKLDDIAPATYKIVENLSREDLYRLHSGQTVSISPALGMSPADVLLCASGRSPQAQAQQRLRPRQATRKQPSSLDPRPRRLRSRPSTRARRRGELLAWRRCLPDHLSTSAWTRFNKPNLASLAWLLLLIAG